MSGPRASLLGKRCRPATSGGLVSCGELAPKARPSHGFRFDRKCTHTSSDEQIVDAHERVQTNSVQLDSLTCWILGLLGMRSARITKTWYEYNLLEMRESLPHVSTTSVACRTGTCKEERVCRVCRSIEARNQQENNAILSVPAHTRNPCASMC